MGNKVPSKDKKKIKKSVVVKARKIKNCNKKILKKEKKTCDEFQFTKIAITTMKAVNKSSNNDILSTPNRV